MPDETRAISPGIYRHFKGRLYEVLDVAEHTETGGRLVVYRELYGEHRLWARPYEMFAGAVDRDKYPDAGQEWRFERVAENLRECSMADAPFQMVGAGGDTDPCPHCGSPFTEVLWDHDLDCWAAQCDDCGAVCYGDTRTEARDCWNRRAGERTCHNSASEEAASFGVFKCSECGHSTQRMFGTVLRTFRYCPVCGARVTSAP